MLTIFYSRCLFLIVLIGCFAASGISFAQVRWDGGGGNQDWGNALNWNNDQVPSADSHVQLDNTIIDTSYTVLLPADVPVVISSLKIFPSIINIIRLELPNENQLSPALTITGLNYSMEIGANAHFINASGATSGASILLMDSLAIYNGGRYVHRTPRAHAAMVTKLSSANGTEEGIFEFDVPSASSTISLSDRRYGMLVLSSIAANGLVNYTAAGTRPIIIRSKLQVNPGVRLNLNCSDTLFVKDDLLQFGGLINLSTLSRTLVLSLNGNLHQAVDASIVETGTASPVLLLNGDKEQTIDMKGMFSNEIALKVLNAAGVQLVSELRVPYKLQLVKGRIKTDGINLLTLEPDCVLEADSLSSLSYVEGPLRKNGMLGNLRYLFPVGSAGQVRWVSIINGIGSYTIEFVRSNPRMISNMVQGLSHVSAFDYWRVLTDDQSEQVQIELSFFDGNSSGVTDMNTLRVARLYDATWVDGGNSSTSGSAGGDGSVVSNALSGFTPSIPVLFALGSSSPAQNPLPLHFQSINASVQFNYVQLRWQMENRTPEGYFIIQQIQNGNWQSFNRSIGMMGGEGFYEANISLRSVNDGYFRILAISQNDTVVSKVIRVRVNFSQGLILDELFSRYNSQMLELKVSAGYAMNASCIVVDVSGRILRRASFQLQKGSNLLLMNLEDLPKGVLFVRVVSTNSQSDTMKFVSR